MQQPLEEHRSGKCLRTEPSIAGFPRLTAEKSPSLWAAFSQAFLLLFSPRSVNAQCGFSPCAVGFFWKGEGDAPPLFPCPFFSPLPGRGFPIHQPSQGGTFQYQTPAQSNPLFLALAPERETFPHRPLSPPQAALQTDARGSPLSLPFSRPGRRRARTAGSWGRAGQGAVTRECPAPTEP